MKDDMFFPVRADVHSTRVLLTSAVPGRQPVRELFPIEYNGSKLLNWVLAKCAPHRSGTIATFKRTSNYR